MPTAIDQPQNPVARDPEIESVPDDVSRYLYLGRLRIYAQILADELEFEFNHNAASAGRHAVAVADLRDAADEWGQLPRAGSGAEREELVAAYCARGQFEEAAAALAPYTSAVDPVTCRAQVGAVNHLALAAAALAPPREDRRVIMRRAVAGGRDGDPEDRDAVRAVKSVYAAARAVRAGAELLAGWQRFRRRRDAGFGDTAAHENVPCDDPHREGAWRRLREQVRKCDTLLQQFTPTARQDPAAVSALCRANRDLFFRWFHTLVLYPAWWTPGTQAETRALLEQTVRVMPPGKYWEAAARRHHALLAYFPTALAAPIVYARHASDPDWGANGATS